MKATLLEMHPDKEWRSSVMRFDGKRTRGIYGLTLREDYEREQELKKLDQGVSDDW